MPDVSGGDSSLLDRTSIRGVGGDGTDDDTPLPGSSAGLGRRCHVVANFYDDFHLLLLKDLQICVIQTKFVCATQTER